MNRLRKTLDGFAWVKQEWRILLFGFILMFCSSPGQTYFIALFGGQIRADLDLSHGEFGALYSLATLCSALVLLWSGKILDRAKLNYFVCCVALGLGAASFAMSMTASMLSLFLAVFMLRHFGQALMGITSSTTMMRYVPAHKSKAGALAHMGYSAAEAIVPILLVLGLAFMTWRELWHWLALGIVLVLPLLLTQLLFRHARAKQQQTIAEANSLKPDKRLDAAGEDVKSQHQAQWTRAQAVRDPLFYAILPGLTCQSLLYTGYMFHQIHLIESKGWSLSLWAGLYLVFSLTTLSMSFGIGAVVDRLGSLRVIPWINLPMMIGLSALASSTSVLTAIVFMFCMGLSTAGQAACSAPFFSERYGNNNLAAIKSLGSFYTVLMTAVSPIILGWYIDRGVSMDALALGGIAYALIVSSIALSGCRRAENAKHPRWMT